MYHWVACSAREFPASGRVRHIVRKGGLDTLCGHSASYPEIWRGNKTKPDCIYCLEQAQSVGLEI